ncbi:hypothetical protein AgCh_009113 [Apium graveolens]
MWKEELDLSFVDFMKDGAQWLVDNTDIKLVGIDYLSVAAFDDIISAHLVYLERRSLLLVWPLHRRKQIGQENLGSGKDSEKGLQMGLAFLPLLMIILFMASPSDRGCASGPNAFLAVLGIMKNVDKIREQGGFRSPEFWV